MRLSLQCQIATLLEITCHGAFVVGSLSVVALIVYGVGWSWISE